MRTTRFALAAFGFAACSGDIEVDPGGKQPVTDVQVTVRDAYTPQAGVRVIFQGPDGSVISEQMTDANGVAIIQMMAGNVSVIRTYPPIIDPDGIQPPQPRPAEVYTYVDVKAGDRILVGNETPIDAQTSALLVKVPSAVQGNVTVKSSCGTGSGEAPNIAIAVTDCPSMIDFYVMNNGTSFYKRMPSGPSIDLATETFSDTLGSSLSASNLLPGQQVSAEERIVVDTFSLYSSGERNLTNGPATVDLPSLSGVERLLLANIETDGMGREMVGTRDSYTGSTPSTVDASAHVIPYVSQLEYGQSGVSWQQDGGGVVDAVFLEVNVTTGPPPGTEYKRYVIAPYNGSLMQIPAIPAAIYNPTTDDQVSIALGIVGATGGYDAIRAKAFSVPNIVEAAPLNGSITLSYAGTAPGR